MNELPPKTVKAQLVRLDDSLKRIERTQIAGIQRAPGALPVLEAFQLFLENERRKARRRIMLLTAGALFMMAIAAAAGVILVHAQMRKAQERIAHVSSRTEELAAAIAGAERHGADELTALESRFQDESRRIVAQFTALLEAQSQSAGQEHESAATLETLQERLDLAESDNERLRSRLGLSPAEAEPSVRTEAVSNAGEPGSDASAERPQDRLQDDPMASAIAAAGPAVTAVTHPLALLLTIVPDGDTRGIRWQLPPRFTRE